MAQQFLFDTDVLIDYLRNRPEAVACVEQRMAGLATSALVVSELFAGVRDGARKGFEVDTVVLAEPAVFARDDRANDVWRDILDRHPGIHDLLAEEPLLQHEHRSGRIDEAVGNHQQQHNGEPPRDDPDDDPDPSLGPLGWLKVGIVWAAAATFVALSGRLVNVPVFGPYAGLGALALVVLVVMRGRWYLVLATAVCTMVGGYLLFDQVLHVPLGRGSGISW